MTDGIWIAIIGGLVTILVAGIPGIWHLYRTAIREAEERALAQARNEALVREANAALAAKDAELATKDAVIARQEVTIAELRQIITNLSTEARS